MLAPASAPNRSWPFAVPAKYELLRGLGAGGMGIVFLARDRRLGRLCALKFLRESCEVFRERFHREARMLARLEHPSIVKVHELDAFAGRTYLAMEYVEGGSLAVARLGPRALVRAARGLADALALAHAHGIVHRDVKPENVLLRKDGRAVLSDFGLALEPDEGSPRDEARPVAGTPLTMSPEQARGARVGPASDVFSLGVTLYRQLTGCWPFGGRTAADVLLAIVRDPPPPPRELAKGIPAALEAVVLRCLEKDPARRFSSMAELGDALERSVARWPGSWLGLGRVLAAFGRRGTTTKEETP